MTASQMAHQADAAVRYRSVDRPWWRPGWAGCGCLHPRRHDPGCLWMLSPAHRVQVAAALVVDPIPAPRLAPDRECELLARIRADADYARTVAAWLTRRAAR